MLHTYRNIEPLNIEWFLTSWTIRLMCIIVIQFSNLFQGKQKLGSTPPSIHIFLITPLPEFPGQKQGKKLRKCGQTSFISDMKLYTISLQNHNKKNSPVNFGASSLNSFTGTLLHEFRKALILLLSLPNKVWETYCFCSVSYYYYYSSFSFSPFFPQTMNLSTADLRNYWTEFLQIYVSSWS